MLQAIDLSIVNVAVPQIQRQLGGSIVQVGWTVTGYAIASLVAMPLAAGLAARKGTRAYVLGSVALFTAASVGCALSRSSGVLILFRVVQGLGAGGLLPLSQGILMSLFARERRGTAVALVGLAAVIGPLIGPPLGGILTDRFGWQSIFWVNLPVGAMSLALLIGFLHVQRSEARPGPLDAGGVALLAATVVALQVACAHQRLLFIPAIFLGWMFVRRERTAENPSVDLGVLRHRALAGTLAAAPLYGVGLYGSLFLAPLLLERELGLTAAQAGFAMAAGGMAGAALIVSARPLLARFRPRSLCALGAAMFAVSMLLHARLAFLGQGEAVFPQALRGAGTGLLYVGMNGFAFDRVPEGELATSASLFYLLRQLGGSLGIALSASALDALGTSGSVGSFAVLALTAPLSLLPMALGDPNRTATEAG